MANLHGMDLGTFGIYTFGFEHQPAAQMRESIRELEEQGWRSFWFPEVGGREALTHAGFLLSCAERIHIVNGIAQISAREPRQAFGASLLLADAYPGRHVLGLGVGRSRPGIKPVAAMTEYLDELAFLAETAGATLEPASWHPAKARANPRTAAPRQMDRKCCTVPPAEIPKRASNIPPGRAPDDSVGIPPRWQ